MKKTKWVKRPASQTRPADALAKEMGLNKYVVRYMMSKGYKTAEAISYFLNFSYENLRKDYLHLEAFMTSLEESIKNKDEFTIYGDYDCDGITATVIWVRALERLGLKVNWHVNDRNTEGYGMTESGVQRLLQNYPDTKTIITCDNGIAALDVIQHVKSEYGIKVLVTDHHLKPEGVVFPDDIPVIDEWQPEEDADKREASCGAEIARRMVEILYSRLDKSKIVKRTKARKKLDDEFIHALYAYSGLATIADVVDLTPANHFVAKVGIDLMNEENCYFPVFNAIKEEMGISTVTYDTLGFQYGPLINAVSRMSGSCDLAVEVLLSDGSCREKVQKMVEMNSERKDLTNRNFEIAVEEIQTLRRADSFYVLTGTEFKYDAGLAGLVASKVVEREGKPCIILARMDEKTYKGSARSLRSFNVKEALDECADLLDGYGGHAFAAGLTISRKNIKEFRERMNKLVEASGCLEVAEKIYVDYETTLSKAEDANAQALMSLAPFGTAFEEPAIVVDARIEEIKFMPKNVEKKVHVSYMIHDPKKPDCKMKAVWWNSLSNWTTLAVLSDGDTNNIRIMGNIGTNEYKGKVEKQLVINDLKIK